MSPSYDDPGESSFKSDNGNGDDCHSDNELIDQLNALFELEGSNRYLVTCEAGNCSNISYWAVVWMDGSCEHMPTKVCALGKIVLDDALLVWEDLKCSNCGAPMVPATIVQMPYTE